MSSVSIYASKAPTTETGPGGRLYAAFLAGRSPHTLRAYGADLEAFAVYLGESSPGAALSRLIGLPAGEGNGLLLAYRARMIDAALTPATINRRLAAIRSALKLARTLGLTAWAPEIRGLKVEAYRDTTGPGLAGTRAMLAKARAQTPVKAARDAALVRLMFDLGLRRGEVTGLDLEDLDAKERRLWIRGKGRTQKEARTLPEPGLPPTRCGTTPQIPSAPHLYNFRDTRIYDRQQVVIWGFEIKRVDVVDLQKLPTARAS